MEKFSVERLQANQDIFSLIGWQLDFRGWIYLNRKISKIRSKFDLISKIFKLHCSARLLFVFFIICNHQLHYKMNINAPTSKVVLKTFVFKNLSVWALWLCVADCVVCLSGFVCVCFFILSVRDSLKCFRVSIEDRRCGEFHGRDVKSIRVSSARVHSKWRQPSLTYSLID